MALVKLRHRSSGVPLWVANIHLMTTSRDNARLTRYPGELRAQELAFAARHLADRVDPEIPVVVCGDFNTCPDDHGVFAGDVGCPERIATQFHWDDMQRTWRPRQKQSGPGLVLHEAFADLHSWGRNTSVCTSRTSKRAQWLDYIWYSPSTLRAHQRSSGLSSARGEPPLPSVVEPSDHVPMGQVFSVR